jgi:hypothetical protein
VGDVDRLHAVRRRLRAAGRRLEGPFYRAQIERDPRFAAELDYCAPRGIAHSVFLGWPDEDQDKALAWAAEEAERCPGCHTPLRLALDKKLQDDWEADPQRCHVCATRRIEEMRWSDEPEVRRAGLLIPVKRRS